MLSAALLPTIRSRTANESRGVDSGWPKRRENEECATWPSVSVQSRPWKTCRTWTPIDNKLSQLAQLTDLFVAGDPMNICA